MSGLKMDRRQFLKTTAVVGAAVGITAQEAQGVVSSADLPTDITDMSASLLSAAIRQRVVSCEEVMEAYLSRIHRLNPTYNALVSMRDDDLCLAEARRADDALARNEYWGWMHGMPHAVKDLANVEGMPTSSGSPIFAGTIAERDSLLVSRMRGQGALFIGKTNTPEFGMGSQTYNPVFGATGSAYDPALTAGGSSGGAACGLGTRMLPVADGGDMMGSLRNPGAFNNVIGFRPSQGRVPGGGAGDLYYQQLGIGGPMGRTVEDTIRLLKTVSGYDPSTPLSLRDELPPFESYRGADLSSLRVGWMGDYDGYLAMEPGILDLCEVNLRTLEAHGSLVEPCLPDYDMGRLWETWLTLRHWSRHGMMDLYEDPERRRLLKPEAVWEIEGALGTTAGDVYEAGRARADWFRALEELFESYDVLALPTAQVFPFPKTIHWPDSIHGRSMDTYHRWMEVVIGGTLAGLPVVNVPVGFDERGRPMGMQLMGRVGDDQRVLEIALAYEAVTDHLERRPDVG